MVVKNVLDLLEAQEIVPLRPQVVVEVEKMVEIKDLPVRPHGLKDPLEAKIDDLQALPHGLNGLPVLPPGLRGQNKTNGLKVKTAGLKDKTNDLRVKIAVHKTNGLKLKLLGLRGLSGQKDLNLKAPRPDLRGLKINDLKLPNNSLGL